AWMPAKILPALFARLFPASNESANAAYYVTFVLLVSFLIIIVVFILSKKYSTAIWSPIPRGGRKFLLFCFILLPLFLFHTFNCMEHIRSIIYWTAPSRPNANQMLASTYEYNWTAVGFDGSLVGIICGSVVALAAPVLEEVLLTGFLLNLVAKDH